jgi:hypothetical protein
MMRTKTGYLCALKPDMQSGAVLHETGQHFRLLLEEAREIGRKIHIAKGEANTDEIYEYSALEMMELHIQG